MIYQYPKEFIVPVVYDQDLKDNTTYRYKKSKFLHAGKLVMPDDEVKENEIFLAKVDIYGDFQNKDIKFLNMEGEILQEPSIKDDMFHEGLEHENIKSILKDIDEDYANSETMKM